MQTLGLSGKLWFCRWKVIGNAYVTLLMLLFVAVALYFAFCGEPEAAGKCAAGVCGAAGC